MLLRSGNAPPKSDSKGHDTLSISSGAAAIQERQPFQPRTKTSALGCKGGHVPVRTGFLGLLPAALLGRVWPLERLIHGLLVAKWLRDELYSHADVVALSAAQQCGCQIESKTISSSLARWRNKGAKLELNFEHTEDFFVDCLDFCISSNFHALLCVFPTGVGSILSHLNLSYCFLGDFGIELLARSIKECSVLASLLLDGNQVSDESAKMLATELRHCRALCRLDLGGNFFHDWTFLLSCVLENCKALLHLNFWRWEKLEKTSSSIPAAEEDTLSLRHQVGNPYALAALGSPFSLSALDISCYSVDIYDDVEEIVPLDHNTCAALGLVLGQLSALSRLDLSATALGEGGFQEICSTKGLSTCTSLTQLKAPETQMGDDGLRYLAQVLESCKGMRELILSSNCFQAGAGELIARIVRSCRHLQRLDLSHNVLGDNGMTSIAGTLCHAACLKRLDLENIGMHAAGAQVLSKGVSKCAALEILNVCDNDMHDEGSRWMAAAVKSCKSMVLLDVSYTGITKSGAEKLARASTKKRRVVFIMGRHCLVTAKERNQLDRTWAGRCVFDWT